MNIRIFTSNDLEQCLRLFIDVFNGEPWNDHWSSDLAELYLKDYMNTPGFKGIVAEDDGKIIGFILGISKRWWKGNEFFIQEMCVSSNRQRTGIGTSLFNYLDKRLKEEGIENIILLTNRGIPAERFYIKNGFKEIKGILVLVKRVN